MDSTAIHIDLGHTLLLSEVLGKLWYQLSRLLRKAQMSALGQKRTFGIVESMSALPPKADTGTQSRNVRFRVRCDLLAAQARD
jgi:hypothetical protein